MPQFTKSPILGMKYRKAVNFAAIYHKNQIRKDSGQTPYLSHLLSVSALVMEVGGSEDEAIAALLHDAVEDVGVKLESIEDLFGEYVSSIVLEVSEDKNLPKQERKNKYIDRVSVLSVGAFKVSIADKLHNLRSYRRSPELCTVSVELFYRSLITQYQLRLPEYPECLPLLEEMLELYSKISWQDPSD